MKEGLRPTVEVSAWNRDYLNIVESCWESIPSKRPTAKELKEALETLRKGHKFDSRLSKVFTGISLNEEEALKTDLSLFSKKNDKKRSMDMHQQPHATLELKETRRKIWKRTKAHRIQ